MSQKSSVDAISVRSYASSLRSDDNNLQLPFNYDVSARVKKFFGEKSDHIQKALVDSDYFNQTRDSNEIPVYRKLSPRSLHKMTPHKN